MMRSNQWFKTHELSDNIWRIEETFIDPSEQGHFYFVRGRNQDLLIDGGYGIVPLCENVPLIDPNRTVFIATHTHYDHIGAGWEFSERWVHPLEAEIMAKPTQKNTAILPFLDGRSIFTVTPPQWSSVHNYHITPAPATRLLQDGDLIDLGDRQFAVIHTPGHSPGSISLWEAETGILFSADVLYDGVLLDTIEGAHIPDLLKSQQRLAQLPIQKVYPGHYGSFDGQRATELIATYRSDQNI